MTFDEAWERRKRQQNIVPIDSSDEQHFRHGWNAALMAAAAKCEEMAETFGSPCLGCARETRALEVEVQT